MKRRVTMTSIAVVGCFTLMSCSSGGGGVADNTSPTSASADASPSSTAASIPASTTTEQSTTTTTSPITLVEDYAKKISATSDLTPMWPDQKTLSENLLTAGIPAIEVHPRSNVLFASSSGRYCDKMPGLLDPLDPQRHSIVSQRYESVTPENGWVDGDVIDTVEVLLISHVTSDDHESLLQAYAQASQPSSSCDGQTMFANAWASAEIDPATFLIDRVWPASNDSASPFHELIPDVEKIADKVYSYPVLRIVKFDQTDNAFTGAGTQVVIAGLGAEPNVAFGDAVAMAYDPRSEILTILRVTSFEYNLDHESFNELCGTRAAQILNTVRPIIEGHITAFLSLA